MKLINKSLTIFILVFGLVSCTVAQSEFDHSYGDYGKLLSTYVSSGLVDYDGMKKNSTDLQNAISSLAITTGQYAQFSSDQKISYLINAYNLFTIKAIIDNYPVKSIKDVSGVWNKLKFPIAGESLTLDNVEHDMLRKEFKEPRVHVAIVCASISCPELWDHPFTADSLEFQLNTRSFAFANDPIRNLVKIDEKKIELSKILKWYGDDFVPFYSSKDQFSYMNKKENATVNFLFQFWPQEIQLALLNSKISTKYGGYDWNLNEQK